LKEIHGVKAMFGGLLRYEASPNVGPGQDHCSVLGRGQFYAHFKAPEFISKTVTKIIAICR